MNIYCNKYTISIFVLLCTLLYIHTREQLIETENNHTSQVNPDKFIPTFNNECVEDNCRLSVSITETVKNIIIKEGLENTINNMKKYPHKYQTKKGDYVFIWKKANKEDYFILYHTNDNINNSITYESDKKLIDVCPTGNCNLTKVIHTMTLFADDNDKGFVEYIWYDSITKEEVLKRSYVEKIRNISTGNTNETIYIGSGSTVELTYNPTDYTTLLINVIFYIVFLLLWYSTNIEHILNITIANTIFTIIIVLKFIYMINIHKHVISIKDQELLNTQLNQIGGILAGLTLSLSLFFRAFLDIKFDRRIAKNILYLYTLSFIFAIASLIHVPSKNTLQMLQIKYNIKNEFLYLTSIFFTLSIICITFNFR
jgi:hypothetical protein